MSKASTKNISDLYSDQSALYKLIIEIANEGIWIVDENNVTAYMNDKMATMLGYQAEDVIGKALLNFMDEPGFKRAIKGLNRRKQGVSDTQEVKLITRAGREIWTQMNISPIIINDTFRGLLGMVTDITESKLHEQRLLESHLNYISLFEDSPIPIWDEDFSQIKQFIDDLKQKGITDFRTYFEENPDELIACVSLLIVNNINNAVVELNEARSKEEVLERFYELRNKKSNEYAINQLVAIAENKTSCAFDAELKTFSGNIRHVHFKWSVVKGFEHNYKRVYLSTADMTERIVDENLTLQNSNREKAVLLKEIHHRVKNNLQIVTSLLNLQTHGIEDAQMKSLYEMSLSRIKSMATVHELLYQSGDFSKIDYKEYLKTLVSSLVDSMKGQTNNISVNLNVKDIKLNIHTSIPLGLLINEIITNSLKHGIYDDEPGSIYIEIYRLNAVNFEMKIGDNGKGIPSDFNITETDTLGLQLVSSLTEQLMGTLERNLTQKGTHFIIRFQELLNG